MRNQPSFRAKRVTRFAPCADSNLNSNCASSNHPEHSSFALLSVFLQAVRSLVAQGRRAILQPRSLLARRALLPLLLAASFGVAACSDPAPTGQSAADAAKDAAGVDAEFGVETFALTNPPALTFVSPAEEKYYYVDYTAPVAVKITVQFTVTDFTLGAGVGQVICRVNGAEPPLVTTTNSIANINLGTAMGARVISCTLASPTGELVKDATATANLHVYISQDQFSNDAKNKCSNDTQCDDTVGCSQDACVGGKCVFKYAISTQCCTTASECSAGLTCVGSGTGAKCSACTGDPDCDDSKVCTIDKCDLSGPVGKCTNNKPTPDVCCDPADLCDDGQACTTDSCDVVAQKCLHIKGANACCGDNDCISDNPCMAGSCVAGECRFGKNNFKPGCCIADGDCDDKYYCTLDTCGAMGPNGYKLCDHKQDPSKGGAGVCCDLAGDNGQCNDGNGCTWDVCLASKCQHTPVSECCKLDIDCKDASTCTLDACEIPKDASGVAIAEVGQCKHPKSDPLCCEMNTDCGDGKYCTVDMCNKVNGAPSGTCKFTKTDATCCDIDGDCNDGKYCTSDVCVNHFCVHGPDTFKPNCCEFSNSECDDKNPCTANTCDTANKKCVYTAGPDTSCCVDSSTCNDNDCTTTDYCDSFNTCKYQPAADACKADVDCDDGLPCTDDKCDTSGACGKCTHSQNAGCCQADYECDDSKAIGTTPPNPKAACTADKCVQNKCAYAATPNCCVDDADAMVACDDKNSCTIDYCLNNQCRHTVPKNGCCATAADCFDGSKCTTDSCTNIVAGTGQCQFKQVSGCLCSVTEAQQGLDCNDNNACTADSCSGGICTHAAIDSCCIDKYDCDDGSPCTYDYCLWNECTHTISEGANKLCCNVTTQDIDCAYLNSDCSKGLCQAQADGALKCVAQQLDVCTVNVGYCQDFQSGTSLVQMGWNPTDLGTGKAANNWLVGTDTGLGPDQHAKLTWTPTVVNFETCLQSPVIQAAGAKTITLQYDREFVPNGGDFDLKIYGSLGGASPDWKNAVPVDFKLGQADGLGPETVDLVLPDALSGSNGLRLAFCVGGASTYDMSSYALDNICVVKGHKPTLQTCPVNQTVPYGSTKTVPVKAADADADAILSFQLVDAPEFVTISSALYYWLDNTWNANISIKPSKVAHVGTWPVTVKVTDGSLYSTCTFNITVTYVGGYLVWRPIEVPALMGTALFDAIKAEGKTVQNITDLTLYPNLKGFQGVFVSLGVYPDNHILTQDEAQQLQQYLANAGKLYVEGGDTWFFDTQTTVHPAFAVKPVDDSFPSGVTGPLTGTGLYTDINSGQSWNFAYAKGDPSFDSLNDVLAATTAERTKGVLKNDGKDKGFVQVGHDDPLGYRTVASSVLFAGVQTDPQSGTPQNMMNRLLYFFSNGFEECLTDAGCEDNNGCTSDKCTGKLCYHKSTCICSSAATVACGASLTITSNASGSTNNAVQDYGCDTTTQYKGKEYAIKFAPVASVPVQLKITNLSVPNAKVFVLKGNAGACDASQCFASGSSTYNFAAAQGNEYFIVLDTPDGTAAQADIVVNCGTPEVCTDGIDNNNNGQVDCKDLASCCGDAACPETCDNVDNDCDGAIDEGCDSDGDDYCNSNMILDGASSACPKGGGDCDDGNVNVNPGVQELCGNGLDDNCTGQGDEEGALGCTNYWADLDADKFGAGLSKCMCSPAGSYSATKSGDCKDDDALVNPAMIEVCGNGKDDDCTGTQNDANAQGCSDFYTDGDGDAWGTLPKKCQCVAQGVFSGVKSGDCNDINKNINPDSLEVCNNQDDNCNNIIDEGCDDDKDGYCDANLGYVSIGGSTTVCGAANQGQNLTLDCGAGNYITSVDFASYGTPVGTCAGKDLSTGACHAGASVQTIKTLCLGKTSCTVSVVNATFGGDPCSGTAKILDVSVTCTGAGGTPPDICPKGAGDSDDLDPNINPNGKEICDNKDNNSDGKIDEGCDDDKDGFCDVNMIVVGVPVVCLKGGGDCDDNKLSVNPGASEDCSTPDDDDCNGSLNDQDANNCIIFFTDGDSDGYGVKSFKCYCSPVGLFKAKKTGDCDDTKAAINPGALEVCDNIDNNCNNAIDEGCDDDLDGYCDVNQGVAPGGSAACKNGAGDCNDSDANVNPGKAEICGNGVDDNCNGSQNDAGAVGCTNFYTDGDGDGFGSTSGQCLCSAAGSFAVTNKTDCDDSKKAVNPTALEICDNLDNNCDTQTDEGCDDDNDDYCDAAMGLVGTPLTCSKGGADCNDTDATINPGVAKEICNNKDENCNSQTDEGCDDDKDGFCDGAFTVISPLPTVCLNGTGDCNDLDSDVNPAATEVCGDNVDNNCNGSQNDPNASLCKPFYYDGDLDGVGLTISKCLCTAAGSYSASVGGDCDDYNKNIKPGATEVCGDGIDNNCNGDLNDENATGCAQFYLDLDVDGYGLTGLKKCYCVAQGGYSAANPGDCNDNSAAVNPGKTEVCNDIDDNCKNGIDEGCDDDSDKFCDSTMTVTGQPNACPFGGGDCNDLNANANPGKAEVCDDIDNNCNGNKDEGCDDDTDKYCDSNMVTVGTPATCIKGGGDCNDTLATVNPGVNENCATTIDDNCNGATNDVNATGCVTYGLDADGDTYGAAGVTGLCLCQAAAPNTATKVNDCNDKNDQVNPGMTEICDGLDNNCNGSTDEGCDDDGDKYCDSAMVTVGKPAICINGGGDCNDTLATINPGKAEVCGNTVDENCDGATNGLNATGCTNFYLDGDNDTWTVNVAQCWCVATGQYKGDGTKNGDCDDTKATVNPGVTEVCGDSVDNNCNGTQNDVNATGCVAYYKDADKDGYGAGTSQCQCYAEGAYITATGGDCDDNNVEKYPGLAEKCDTFDNNCNTATDEGCDDDGDKYCDSAMITKGFPAVCTNGGGDCNDTLATVYPTSTEKCDNIDQNCNGVTDDGCDDDKDGYCDSSMTVVGTPAICTSGGGDCDDQNSLVRPGKPEICDNADNNCSGSTDEGCDDDLDLYCDSAMSIVGTPTKCSKGGGDCNDTLATVNPGAAEVCDGVDNNCAAGTDEVCKDSDGDGYCVGTVSISVACPKGGGDCNDTNVNVNPGKTETCATEYDDNCDGLNNVVGATACTNFYTDVDLDGFGTGTATCQCFQSGTKTALSGGDCNDGLAAVNPAAIELCDAVDNNCNGTTDDACDADADLYCSTGKVITSTALCTKSSKPAAGSTKPGDDCNDSVATVNPGMAEICDNLDNNCNVSVDEGCDDDNDNYCDSGMTLSGTVVTCTAGGGDCNDNDAGVKPGATENCTTVADDNCNGVTNEQGGLGCTTYYLDADNDGYGIANTQCWCAISGNYRATKGGDCNDLNAAVFPNTSAESCNNVDDNCNGVTDEGCDDDKDGYCDSTMTYTTSTVCPSGGGDCDDNSNQVKPNATELCDDLDNNCNTQTDEGCNGDGDAYCSKLKVTIGTPKVCTAGGGDCDDTTSLVSPAAVESCNSKDDNCNGLTDEAGATGCSNWYYDGDQDGYGTSSFLCQCAASGLYTTKTTGDCNDTCPTCAPGKAEMCDGLDNNCNNSVDEGCNGDGDGYCTKAMTTVGTPAVCTKGGGDCNDVLATINPGANETCNNVDDNCNGTTDENASDQCPAYPNAVVQCVTGTCQLKSCFKDFYNINGSVSDGCECNGTDFYEPNDTCASAYVVSTSLHEGGNGSKETITARLVDTSDIDWFAVYAADSGDNGYAACDAFNTRVVFTNNPGGGLRFDVWKGSCPAGGNNSVCCGRTDFNWFTNFKSGTAYGGSWSGYGECPCQTGNQFDNSNPGWNLDPGNGGPYCKDYNSGYVCFPTGFSFTQCQDDSSWFYVKVYKATGAANCANYSLEFTNGVYGQPGTGAGATGY